MKVLRICFTATLLSASAITAAPAEKSPLAEIAQSLALALAQDIVEMKADLDKLPPGECRRRAANSQYCKEDPEFCARVVTIFCGPASP